MSKNNKKSTKNLAKSKTGSDVEIVFDFSRVELFAFLDLMESSAAMQNGVQATPEQIISFMRMLRSAYVSSSRPLTVADFQHTIEQFWKSAEVFKNPNV
jgi:hypothetical protein